MQGGGATQRGPNPSAPGRHAVHPRRGTQSRGPHSCQGRNQAASRRPRGRPGAGTTLERGGGGQARPRSPADSSARARAGGGGGDSEARATRCCCSARRARLAPAPPHSANMTCARPMRCLPNAGRPDGPAMGSQPADDCLMSNGGTSIMPTTTTQTHHSNRQRPATPTHHPQTRLERMHAPGHRQTGRLNAKYPGKSMYGQARPAGTERDTPGMRTAAFDRTTKHQCLSL